MMSTDGPRPTMRRKSSAQNLLSSFKTSSNQIQPNVAGSPSLPSVTPTALYGPLPTSGTATPMSREWDSQSLQSDPLATAALAANGVIGVGTQALPQGTSVEFLRDLVQKRMITITYVRNVHEGRSHWFHTIVMTRADLDKAFSNAAMKKRTYRFAILGMSLSNLFEVKEPQDLLKGLINTLNEYDQSKDKEDTGEKSKMRLFRSRMNKRQGVNDYAMTYADASEASYLVTPHMPFPLDYHQTLMSLLDVLSEVYNKISRLLGPSPFPHSQNMMGPLGLLSPHPGVSYLFSGSDPSSATLSNEGEGSLWGIANANQATATGSTMLFAGGSLGSPPPSWTSSFGEMVLKIDSKFKKIISVLLKDLDEFARNGIKDELASLDPLLRNIASSGPRGVYDDQAKGMYDLEGLA